MQLETYQIGLQVMHDFDDAHSPLKKFSEFLGSLGEAFPCSK
jgi:hypothetical protein